MALIQWSDSFSVDVAEIDMQHRRLIDMINELNEAMRQGKGNDQLGDTVRGLYGYAALHFNTEEKYFDTFGYPAAAAHKKEHADFTEKVAEFRDGFEKGRVGLTVQVLNFLSQWLQNHIQGSDRQYGPFFNRKGLH